VLCGGGKDGEEEARMHWAIGYRAVLGREAGLYDSRGLELENGKKWSTMIVGEWASGSDDLTVLPERISYRSRRQGQGEKG
jgi:hypothetical protein